MLNSEEEKMKSLLKTLSLKRVGSYGHRSEGKNLVEHSFNILLSEAFYPLLHLTELGLRNNLDRVIKKNFGSNWFSNNGLLVSPEKEKVSKAIDEIKKHKKQVNHDNLVAELHFGFWTGLLHRKYEQIFWPKLITDVFPNIPIKIRNRQFIANRLHAIRKELRNRTFHHERISHFDLIKIHTEILEAIKWLNNDLYYLAIKLDRFPALYEQKKEIIENLLVFHSASF